MLLTNYKHTQPTLGLSVTFVFNIEYIYTHTHTHTHIHIHTHTYIYTYIHTHTHIHTYIYNRLNSWADKYSVYIEAQAGFRSNMGTVDNIFVLHGTYHIC